MTLAEFKAWLEGFEHSFPYVGIIDDVTGSNKAPTPDQWLLIKEKLAILGSSVISIPQMQRVDVDYQRQMIDAQRLYSNSTSVKRS